MLLSYLAAIIKAVCICLAEPDLYILKESGYLIWSNEKIFSKAQFFNPCSTNHQSVIQLALPFTVRFQPVHAVRARYTNLGGVSDGIDGGQKDYSNSGGVSRLCIRYSSAADISLRQGCRDVWSTVPLSDASFPTVRDLRKHIWRECMLGLGIVSSMNDIASLEIFLPVDFLNCSSMTAMYPSGKEPMQPSIDRQRRH